MPLTVRYIEPRGVRSMPLLEEAGNLAPLQALGVQNLVSAIQQLSSLASHAEGIMGDIVDTLASYHRRGVALEARITILREEVIPKLDPEKEVLEGFEIPHPDLHFKSERQVNPRLLTQQQMPQALREKYEGIPPTPALQLFTALWPDGRDALHMFSNPDFFFDSWRMQIQSMPRRRKGAGDVTSPTRKQSGRKSSKVPSSPKANGTVHHESFLKPQPPVKRGFSLHRRSYHSSTLSLEDAHRRPPLPPGGGQAFRRNTSISRSLRASFRRKTRVKPSQGLSKATAAAFQDQDVKPPEPAPPPPPAAPITNESVEFSVIDPPQKRQSFLRRSFSRRKANRVRSASPRPITVSTPNLLDDSTTSLAQDDERGLTDSSKLSSLPRQHLEKLELGASGVDTSFVAEAGTEKNSSTFLAPANIQTRSISPLDPLLMASRRRINSKSRSSSDAADPDCLPTPRFDRSQTVSGASPSMALRAAAKSPSLRRVVSNADARPISTSPIDHTSQSNHAFSQTSLDTCQTALSQPQTFISLSQPQIFTSQPQIALSQPQNFTSQPASVEPYAVTKLVDGHSFVRPKPRRPAPQKPPRTDLLTMSRVSSGGSLHTPTRKAPPPPSPSSLDDCTASNKNSHSASPSPTGSSGERNGTSPTDLPGEGNGASLTCTLAYEPVIPSLPLCPVDSSTPARYDGALAIGNIDVDVNSFFGHGPGWNGRSEDVLDKAPLSDGPDKAPLSGVPEAATGGGDREPMLSPIKTEPPVPLRVRSPPKVPVPIPSVVPVGLELDPKASTAVIPPPPQLPPVIAQKQNPLTDNSEAAAATDTSAPVVANGVSSPEPVQPRIKQLLRKGSLYISPRKMTAIELNVPEMAMLSVTPETDDTDVAVKRTSRILLRGGVGESSVDTSRSDLLSAIRQGLHLKKVQLEERKHEVDTVSWDVAAILERRSALVDSDESSDDSEVDTDWED